jgi:hypothetical protein
LLLLDGLLFFLSNCAASAGVGGCASEEPGLGASSAVRGERWPVEYDIIISGSSIPGNGPTSVTKSHGELRRRAHRKMKAWWALERTNDWRAFTRKEEAGRLRSRRGSEYHLDCSARDGMRRGRSRATDSRELYLQMFRIASHASHELQASVFLTSLLSANSDLAKRAKSPRSSFSVVAFEPSIGS